MNKFAKYFVSLFGLGYVPYAPGTFGSIFAILIWYFAITYVNIFFFYLIFILVFLSSFQLVNIYLKNEKRKILQRLLLMNLLGSHCL